MVGQYFDDSIQFVYEDIAVPTKLLYVRFLEMFGVMVDHGKRQHMTFVPKFLGHLTDLRHVLPDLILRIWGAPEVC